MAEFGVLGPFEVIADGKTLRLGGPQQRAVLALLVLRANEVVSTDTIIRALWHEPVPQSAAAVVRTYVSRLRRALGTAADARLASRPPGYVLEASPDQVDVHRFTHLVRQARQAAAAGRPDSASTTLSLALGLWRGDALADLTELASLRPSITRLEETRLAAVEDRIDAELALGHHGEVVGELEALTAEQPFRERLWGQLVLALYRSGRQAEALATYRTVRSTLIDQLGIEPGPELQALEKNVLAHSPVLRWPGPANRDGRREPPGTDPLQRIPLQAAMAEASHDGPFVGRAEERTQLMQHLKAANFGSFSAVFVAGAPGIGKTSLAGWFARNVYVEGATVVLGRADEGAGIPFQPFGEAIRHWVTHAPTDDLHLLDGTDAAHLARTVPALAERRRDLCSSPVPVLGDQTDRQRLFDAISRWVEALATRGPGVIVLDDLHWADPATLLAVRSLLRHPPDAEVILLATYRDTEIGSRHELADLLTDAHGDRRVRCIDLAGLLDGDVVDMLVTEVGEDLSPAGRAFATHLNHVAGGNPLFIHEMLRHLTERGTIAPAADQWVSQKPLESFGVPSGISDVVEQRLERLPTPTATVLRQAAVLGEHFDLRVLGRTVDRPGIAVIEALEPALTAGLITHDQPPADQAGPGAEHFAFSHSLVREAILCSLSLSQRARAHWVSGKAIASLPMPDREPLLGEIARHLTVGVHAGDPATAITANVQAGRQALAALAFEDARTRFVTATELTETTGHSDPDLTYETWTGLGDACAALADVDGQRSSYLRAAAIAKEQGCAQRMTRVAVGLAAYLSTSGGGNLDDQVVSTELIDEALTGLGDAPSLSRCLLIALKAMRTASLDQRPEAESLATLAGEIAQSLGDPTALAGALMARCWALLGTPHALELVNTAERALSLGVSSRLRMLLLGFVAPVLPMAALQRGDRAEFEAVRHRLATDPAVQRSPHLMSHLRSWDAALALSDGRFDEAEHLAKTIPGVTDWTAWQVVTQLQTGTAEVERGRHAPIREGLKRQLCLPTAEPYASQMRAMLASLHAVSGDHAAAEHQAEVLRRDITFDRLGWSGPLFLRLLAEVAATVDNPRLAADLLPVLSDYSGQLLVSFTGTTIETAADRAIGQVLLPLGRLDEAIERLTAARNLEESFGAHALVARTTYWLARARLERGTSKDQEIARQLLRQASSLARQLGMAQLEKDISSAHSGS